MYNMFGAYKHVPARAQLWCVFGSGALVLEHWVRSTQLTCSGSPPIKWYCCGSRYTGNGAVGRIVLQAAAKHLTPCTLELGGKSPVYVDKSASLDTCVTRLNVWKFLNAGQTCIAPDYILVHKDVAEAFIEKLKAKVERSYGGKNAGIDQYGRIINGRHVQRVGNMVESSTGTVISGGKVDVGDCFVSPTLIKDPGLGDAVMQQEIFGPVLPIIAVESVEEAIEKMNEVCATPLALYVFSEDSKVNEQVMGNTTSGGVVINGAMEHFGNSNLPFGGVGDSGMGAYHGKWGFDEFTHKRAVMVKDTTFVKGYVGARTFFCFPLFCFLLAVTAVHISRVVFIFPFLRGEGTDRMVLS